MRHWKLWILMALFAVPIVLAPSIATAEENVQYQDRTEIDFDDDTISGDLTRPDGEYVEARKRVRHSNLIRIREDFRDHVLQSVGEL